MSVYRLLKCNCGRQSFRRSVTKNPVCKCGASMRVLPNYYIRYSVDGKRVFEAVGPDRKVAERALKKRQGEVSEEKYFGKRSIAWDQAVNLFLGAPVDVSGGTRAMHENSIRVLSRSLHGKRLRDISVATISDFVGARRTSGATNSTINRDLSTLKRIIAFCIDRGELPSHHVVLDKVKTLDENPARERILSPDEWGRLLIECRKNPRLYLAVMIVSQTGLRKHGVYSLKWEDIDLEHRFLRKVTKGKKKVIIPITNTLYDLLVSARNDSPYVLPSPEDPGMHISLNSNLGFPEACKRAGIDDFRFHDLRHCFATLFVMKTGDIKTASKVLGR